MATICAGLSAPGDSRRASRSHSRESMVRAHVEAVNVRRRICQVTGSARPRELPAVEEREREVRGNTQRMKWTISKRSSAEESELSGLDQRLDGYVTSAVRYFNQRGSFMRKLSMLVAALVGTLAIAVAPAGAITGDFVEDTEHPFVGLVVFYDANGEFLWRCSGSLLTPTVFLTAGHCADTVGGAVTARCTYNRKRASTTTRRR